MKHVAVVGAGIVGACSAAWLQKKGMTVTLLERDAPGEATSFGNAGSLSPTAVTPVAVPGMIRQIPGWLTDPLGPLRVDPAYLFKALPWLLRFLKLANREDMQRCAGALRPLLAPVFDAYEPIVRRAEAQELIRREGIVYVYDSEAAFLAAKPAEDDRRRLGAVLEDLTRAEIERFAPELAPEFRWGTFAPENGFTINPHRLTQMLATSVAEHGGTHLKAEVLDLMPRPDGVTLKLRRDGQSDELAADAVLVCAGAWSHFLAAKVGDKVPLETQRGYHVTVAEAGLSVNRMVNWVTRRVFTTPMEVGMRFAGTVEIAGLDAPPNWERADRLLELGRKMYPAMNTAKISRWMGHRPCLPDSLPVIGPSPRAKNVFYAFGHGHIGMCSASGTARSIAELIAGEVPQVDLSPFRADRF
ncbi:MAG TPA: FAD-dependent oxidoreductase [Burkholderiales bacterium]|nr:FAD-dependent oxidoreductase [Burkholderiales bacterium]